MLKLFFVLMFVAVAFGYKAVSTINGNLEARHTVPVVRLGYGGGEGGDRGWGRRGGEEGWGYRGGEERWGRRGGEEREERWGKRW